MHDNNKVSHSQGLGFKVLRTLSILLVEDNSINQQIITSMMDSLGHKTDVAENGAEATEKHMEHDYDLILMDVRMPLMSGPEATQVIRQMKGEKALIPIIALTADAMEESKKGYYEAGMNDVVTKPIDRDVFLFTIDKVLGEKIHISLAETEEPVLLHKKPETEITDVIDGENRIRKGEGHNAEQYGQGVLDDLENLLLEIDQIEETEVNSSSNKVARLRR
ncbi:response regulator [Kiloniella antarctica]|uniref:Response regulator n=1 Tax=Kiloniella antarctica TaxID=1550907 RepID=A0ABW5BL76_9PROT